jgi:hypothetical protein
MAISASSDETRATPPAALTPEAPPDDDADISGSNPGAASCAFAGLAPPAALELAGPLTFMSRDSHRSADEARLSGGMLAA